MKLNNRLMMIAGKIPKCHTLADVGTDHAYIPIYAVKNQLCERALAADLREGPIKMALANIKRCGMADKIEIRLGNGLEPIIYAEIDVIVIAGMGGPLIRDILDQSLDKASHAELLLLQPNNAADALRRWLYNNGFNITEEVLTLDAGKIYCLICAKWTGEFSNKDEFACYIGEKLLESQDPLLETYLNKKLKELEVIIAGRDKANPDKSRYTESMQGMDTKTCVYIRDRLKNYLGSK